MLLTLEAESSSPKSQANGKDSNTQNQQGHMRKTTAKNKKRSGELSNKY